MPATPCSASFLSCYPSPVSLRPSPTSAPTPTPAGTDAEGHRRAEEAAGRHPAGKERRAEAAEVHRDRDGRPGKTDQGPAGRAGQERSRAETAGWGEKLQDARIEQQRLLAIQARAAYQSGREEYLKLLLNQEHPEKFSRTLTYYDYINKARLEQLASFNETLRQLANVEQDISAQKAEQLSKQGELDSRREALAATRKERQQALAKLNSDYRERDQKLKSRQQDQAELAKVLRTIEETLARQAREAAAGASASARWPPNASVRQRSRPRTSHQPAALLNLRRAR